MAASLYNNAAKAAFTISNAGGNNSHNNLQPYITLYYIIKAKTNTYSISKVINNLDSDSSTDSLSANQGRVLNNKIDNLTTVYTGTNITAPTCEGFGKIKKLYGKTEGVGNNGIIEIVSESGENTSTKTINISSALMENDYIDFIEQKIVRSDGTKEDIKVTNSIVQYADETTISNSDNAEMEVELTKNKAISSINENIGALQEKTNLLNKTKFDLNDYIEDGITVNSSNITLVNDTVMLGLNISKPSGFVANTAVLVATLPKEIAPKVTYSASCAFHNAGSTIIAGYLTVFTDGRITVRTSTKNFSCMCNLVYNI